MTPRIVAREAPLLVAFVQQVFGDSILMISDAGAREPATAYRSGAAS